MKLIDLAATFIGDYQASGSFRELESIDGAQGIMVQCPRCAAGKQAEVGEDGRMGFPGVHYLVLWFANPRNAPEVPPDAKPVPGRWIVQGETLEDLSFVGPNAASIGVSNGQHWHGFLRNGELVTA